MKFRIVISSFLILALCLVGCSTSQVVSNLQLVVDAAGAAFPIIANQAGLSADLTAKVSAYLQAVNTAVVKAAPILASSEPTAQKSAEIAAIFSGILAPNLPSGTPQTVAAAVASVANAVAQFLANFQQSKMLTQTAAKLAKPSKFDVSHLSDIEKKARVNLTNLSNLTTSRK